FVDRDLDDLAEVLVAALGADVAGVDAVFRERFGAGRILREQQMPVVMKVADDGDIDLLDDRGDGSGGVVVVDGDPHQFGARFMESAHLSDGGGDVGGVGVRHRLHDDRVAGAHADIADGDGNGFATRHGEKSNGGWWKMVAGGMVLPPSSTNLHNLL